MTKVEALENAIDNAKLHFIDIDDKCANIGHIVVV